MMSELNQFELPSDIRGEFKIKPNGQCSCSIRAAARLLNISPGSLSENISSVRQNPTKLAKILTDKGFDVTGYAVDGIPDIALSTIAEYYTFEAGRYCTEEAKQIYRLFAAVGVRALIQQALGWKPPTHPQIKVWKKQGKSDEWIADRLLALEGHKEYSQIHEEHGCNGFQIAHCVNELNKPILGGTSSQLKSQRGVNNLRNSLTHEELAALACAQAVTTVHIKSNDLQGYKDCKAVNIEYGTAVAGLFERARQITRSLPA